MFGILFLGAAWMLISAPKNTAPALSAAQKGFLAPDFTLQTLEGEEIELAELRGKVLLVNFWATWCPPCRREMPAFQRVYEDYRDRGFVILAVNATTQDHINGIDPFRQELGLSFPILLDKKGEINRLYQVRALPTSFFIDKKGIITEIIIGESASEALMRTKIEEMLSEN